jgi:hypothetical protein
MTRNLYSLFVISLLAISTSLSAQELSWQLTKSPKAPVACLKSIDKYLYAGFLGAGLLRTADAGETWDTLNNGLPDKGITDILPSQGNDLYVATLNNGVFYSPDGGLSWKAFNRGLNASLTLCLLQKGNTLYAGTSQGVYTATTKEGIWTRQPFPISIAPNQIVTCLYQTSNLVLAGSSKSLYVSEGNERIWREIPNVTNYQIVAITENKGRLLFATTGNGIVESDLNVRQITKSPEFLGRDTAKMVSSLLLLTDGRLLKGTNSKGVYQTDSTLNRGLLDFEVKALAEHKNILFAGTYRQGVVIFKPTINLAPFDVANSDIGTGLQMNLNPNPAGQEVSINFSLAGESSQKLSCVLLSPEGRLIKHIIRNQSYSPGQHFTEIEVQNLASGIYYCIITNKEGTLKVTRQLIVNH